MEGFKLVGVIQKELRASTIVQGNADAFSESSVPGTQGDSPASGSKPGAGRVQVCSSETAILDSNDGRDLVMLTVGWALGQVCTSHGSYPSKLRHREVKKLVQGLPASPWWRGLKPRPLDTEPVTCTQPRCAMTHTCVTLCTISHGFHLCALTVNSLAALQPHKRGHAVCL